MTKIEKRIAADRKLAIQSLKRASCYLLLALTSSENAEEKIKLRDQNARLSALINEAF